MNEWLGATDCRVCAAMRERLGAFLGAGVLTFIEGLLWIGAAFLCARPEIEPSFFLVGTAGGLVCLAVLLRTARRRLLGTVALWLDHRLAPGLFERGVQARLGGHNYGLEVPGDLATFRNFLASDDCLRLYDLMWLPLAIAAGFWVDQRLGLILLGTTLFSALLFLAATRASRQYLSRASLGAMVADQRLETAYRNAEDVESMGLMPALLERWTADNDLGLAMHQRIQLWMTWTRGAAALAAAASLVASLALLVLAAGSSLSAAAPVLAAVILWALSVRQIEPAIGWWSNFRKFRDALARLKAFATAPPYRREVGPAGAGPAGLRVERAHYAFCEGAPMLLKEISFALEPEDMLGIIGPSGAGKSTLARLLAGAAPPTTGSIRLDGAELFAIERAEARKLVGYLRQDVELFDASIAENIARMGEVDLNKVVAAARLAGVHDVIAHRPDGYEFQVGPQGERLSGALRQQVALARAVYDSPRLVVLDEPGAHLDGEGELQLYEAMQRIRQSGAIVILVTQRPAAVQKCEQLLLLRDGAIDAIGPARDVLARLSPGRTERAA